MARLGKFKAANMAQIKLKSDSELFKSITNPSPHLKTTDKAISMPRMFKLHRYPSVALFLACFVLLRSLVPVGFMPDMASLSQGKIDFVICTGMGFKTIQVDPTTLKPVSEQAPTEHPSSHQPTNTICPFFSLTSTALPILLLVILLGLFATIRSFYYLPAFLRFNHLNQAARPRAPPRYYFAF